MRGDVQQEGGKVKKSEMEILARDAMCGGVDEREEWWGVVRRSTLHAVK